ncbi:MAG TPA: ComF family protein [Campylobacterales bacterium]|nr:ComF family protein [Campylobacterales bacterium]
MILKCIFCDNYSLSIVCKSRQSSYFTPSLTTRTLSCGLKVNSFYNYSDIDRFIKTKHTYHGSKFYNFLARNSFLNFSKNFEFPSVVYALPIDDKLSKDYSHTAILAKQLKSKSIKPIYNALRAKNSLSYSNQTLDFRLSNPRNFNYTFKENIDVILVDDIVTTGTTLSEAYSVLKSRNVNVLFALTLADARL